MTHYLLMSLTVQGARWGNGQPGPYTDISCGAIKQNSNINVQTFKTEDYHGNQTTFTILDTFENATQMCL